MFKHISEVAPPKFRVGQSILVQCSGKMNLCEVTRVVMAERKQGRTKGWTWAYTFRTDADVSIMRDENELQ